MKRLPSLVSRRTLLVGGVLVLALALVSGIRSTSLSAAIGWYDAPACDDVEAQNPGDPNGCAYEAQEGINIAGVNGLPACADGVDNDSDELTDCLDPDCLNPNYDGPNYCGGGVEWCNFESAQFAGQDGDCGGDDGVNKCQDGLDNDSDGLFDCEDPDCAFGSGTLSQVCDYHGDPVCPESTCYAGSIGQDEWACGGNCSAQNCGDGQDNDGNGPTDYGDPSCESIDEGWCGDDSCGNGEDSGNCPEDCGGACQAPENNPDTCGDGIDNDGDGTYDCDDADCEYGNSGTCWWASTGFNPANWFSEHETDCGNGQDDDGDGFYDCADISDCSSDQNCSSTCNENPSAETSPNGYFDWGNCGDGQDNDGDNRVDCQDADCVNAPACSARPCESTEQDADGNCEADNPYWGPSCGDGFDNDNDGYADCDDSDCSGDPACGGGVPVTEITPDGVVVNWYIGNGYCVDGYDNDNNGPMDCWDDACKGQDYACDSFNLGGEGWPYGGAGGLCGNDICNSDEDGSSCSQDCGTGPGWCGDNNCGDGEDSVSCPSDCGSGGYCGDDTCEDSSGEDCVSCSSDCGDCRISEAPDCDDGVDNEGDGLVDCDDPDCSADSSCYIEPPENCYTATRSALQIATDAGWNENGYTNVANWDHDPSGGWDSRVINFLQDQAQSAVRSAILNSLAGDGHVLFSIGGCFTF